jgi:hypothetical protein
VSDSAPELVVLYPAFTELTVTGNLDLSPGRYLQKANFTRDSKITDYLRTNRLNKDFGLLTPGLKSSSARQSLTTSWMLPARESGAPGSRSLSHFANDYPCWLNIVPGWS